MIHFGLLFKFFEIDFINDTAQPISTPGAKNSLYFIIIQHLLKIAQSFFICA